MNLIMENWRGYLNEANEPTVGEFVTAFAKSKPALMRKVLGISSKVVAGIAAGALIGATGGGAAAMGAMGAMGVKGGAAGVAGALAGETGTQALQKAVDFVMPKIAQKSKPLAMWMHRNLLRGVPDDQRKPIDAYFDLDDEFKALITGGAKDSPLFKKFAKELAEKHAQAFAAMDQESDLGKPLSDFLAGTASQYLQSWLKDGALSPELAGITITKQEA